MHPEISRSYHFIRQPITDANSEIYAYELLARDGQSDLACPLLQSMDDNGIRQLDLDALELAIALAPSGIPHHVNASKQSVGDWGYFARLGKALKDGVEPSMVVVEVNEETLPTEVAQSWLACVKGMGFPVYLDDFGTYHSNNLALSMFRPAGLKIDGEIVRKVSDRYNVSLVRKELEFCLDQDPILGCVAEHVENEAILVKLEAIARKVGYPKLLYQGWYFGKGERVEC